MRYYRKNDNWLKHRILKKIRTDHEGLTESGFQQFRKGCLKYLFDRKRWWLIMLLIIFTYYLGTKISFNLINLIHLDPASSKIIVDQRTSNTATIISMTLAVVGFLMSNLAVKESFAYKLLFKNSKLYPIIYFILSTIGSLMIISLLRDSINNTIFSKLVITGTYLVILVLFLIGYLFRSIIHFTNSNKIHDLLHFELLEEAKRNLKNALFKKYGLDLYDSVMQENGAKEYNWSTAFDNSAPNSVSIGKPQIVSSKDFDSNDLFPKGKFLKDIHISKVSAFVSSKKEFGNVFYKRLQIGEATIESDNYILAQTLKNSEEERDKLRKYLVLKKKIKLVNSSYDVRNYFDEKLEEYSAEGKHRGIDFILSSYLDLYELEMKTKFNHAR